MEVTPETRALFEDRPETATPGSGDRPVYVTLAVGAGLSVALVPVLLMVYQTAPLMPVAIVAAILGMLAACCGTLGVALARHGRSILGQVRRTERPMVERDAMTAGLAFE